MRRRGALAAARAWIAPRLRAEWEPGERDAGVPRLPGRALLPLGEAVYGAVVRLRERGFDWGLIKTEAIGLPVISVGNLTVGGTGKTMAVDTLARRLVARGQRVGIVSRGYGRTTHGPLVVADGTGGAPLLAPEEAGDEPWLLAQSLQVPVAVGERRVEAARLLRDRAALDVVLLDDGFQHRRLRRDLDLVVVDAEAPLGNGRLLPAGPLREPPAALARADALVVVRRDAEAAPTQNVLPRALRAWFAGPVLPCRRRWTGGHDGSGALRPLDELRGAALVVVCGVGDPAAVLEHAARAGAEVRAALINPDHHPYDARDLAAVARRLAEVRAASVLTTAKDWVKLSVLARAPNAPVSPAAWWVAEAELEFDARYFEPWFAQAVRRLKLG